MSGPCARRPERAVEQARGGGPVFIEALTYRFVGHSRIDPGRYRPAGELDRWRARDPLLVARARLIEQYGVSAQTLDEIDQRRRTLPGRDRTRQPGSALSRSRRARQRIPCLIRGSATHGQHPRAYPARPPSRHETAGPGGDPPVRRAGGRHPGHRCRPLQRAMGDAMLQARLRYRLGQHLFRGQRGRWYLHSARSTRFSTTIFAASCRPIWGCRCTVSLCITAPARCPSTGSHPPALAALAGGALGAVALNYDEGLRAHAALVAGQFDAPAGATAGTAAVLLSRDHGAASASAGRRSPGLLGERRPPVATVVAGGGGFRAPRPQRRVLEYQQPRVYRCGDRHHAALDVPDASPGMRSCSTRTTSGWSAPICMPYTWPMPLRSWTA